MSAEGELRVRQGLFPTPKYQPGKYRVILRPRHSQLILRFLNKNLHLLWNVCVYYLDFALACNLISKQV